ncbi:MAG: DUF3501 family protein [Alphaproteobacteria bacterium]|nr:DUF3501 family protein [Alphaproteobacteria bacterium]
MPKHAITRDDILAPAAYEAVRRVKRQEMTALKRPRRLAVGPVATFYFENYDTMWFQVHEMLAIEGGGEAQIPDELQAYNPLVPQGRELVATVMFEIDDPDRRKAFLGKLGGVEETMVVEIDGETIKGWSEQDVDRTSEDGKASSVQFVHFEFTAAQIVKFRQPGTRVMAGIQHAHYGHLAILPEASRVALAADFD